VRLNGLQIIVTLNGNRIVTETDPNGIASFYDVPPEFYPLGYFASPRPLAGAYQLVVIGAGFTPLHGTLRAEPGAKPSLHPALDVQLGIFGDCSIAHTQ
jgi:hypothetical protein